MDWLILLHLASYGAALVIIAAFALIYAARSQFMPYHAAVIERPWHTLDAPLQFLLLALIRLLGWGWLAIACAGLVMLYQLFVLRVPLPLLVLLQAYCLLAITPIIAVTSQVKRRTNGSPPVMVGWVTMMLCWLGFLFGLLARACAQAERLMKNNLFWKTMEGLRPLPNVAQLLGWKLVKHEQRTRELFVEFDASSALTNPVGKIQGGMLTAMLDDCMGPAIYALLEQHEIALTTKMATCFLRPASPGRITGIGKLQRRCGDTCYTRGELKDSMGRTLATATARYKIIDLAPRNSVEA